MDVNDEGSMKQRMKYVNILQNHKENFQ